MKNLFVIFFLFINVGLVAQTNSKLILSKVEGFNIKISQLNDTAVKLIIPKEFNKKCHTIVYLHGGGFLQAASLQTSTGGFNFSILSDEMKKKLTIGSKITFEAICSNSNGKHAYNPYYGSTYTIVKD